MKKIVLISTLLMCSLCTTTYAQEEVVDFSIDTARAHQTSLIQTIKRIEKKLENLDELFPETDKEYDKYKESRKDIITIINDISTTANSMSSDLTRISKYQNELLQKTKHLIQLEDQTKKTKNSIERLTRLLYQLHNEIYDKGVIDDIKIFTKVDNITDAANQEIYMELLLRKLQTLMDELQSDTNNTTKTMRANYEHKNNLQKQVVSYQSNIKDIEKKVAYLESYMELLQENKEAINNHIQDIVNTRTDIENKILRIANDIQQETFAPIWDWESSNKKIKNLTNYGAENIYVISWPVLPITYIKWYFNDP
jgi:chromosome segregation ATPase